MIIAFRVPCIPVAQPRQRHRIIHVQGGKSFAHNYTPKNDPVNAFKAAVKAAAYATYQGAPLEGPIWLGAMFVFPRPQNMVWKKRDMPRAYKCSKPDVDNLFKALTDALNGLVWRDDSQIAHTELRKLICSGDEQPHVEVEIQSREASGLTFRGVPILEDSLNLEQQ